MWVAYPWVRCKMRPFAKAFSLLLEVCLLLGDGWNLIADAGEAFIFPKHRKHIENGRRCGASSERRAQRLSDVPKLFFRALGEGPDNLLGRPGGPGGPGPGGRGPFPTGPADRGPFGPPTRSGR